MATFPIARGYGTSTGDTGLILRGFSIGAAPAAPLTLITRGFGGRGPSLIKRGYSSYIGLPEPPIQGEQYTDITALTFTGFSLLQANPGATLADVLVTDLTTAVTNYSIVVNGDGTGYVNAGGDLTRQTFQSTYFSVSGQAVQIPSNTIDINDNPPQLITPLPAQFNYPLGAAVNLDFVNGTPQYVLDPDGDPLTMTLTGGNLPPGISISGTALVGTTTSVGHFTAILTLADPVGESLVIQPTIFVFTLITMPDLTGDTQASALAQLAALGLQFGGFKNGFFSDTVPIGLIVGQSTPAGSQVTIGTIVFLNLSLGPQGPAPFATIQGTIEALSAAGFVASPVFIYVYSTSVPDGYVISISPPPTSDVPINTPVQLTVSLGPPNPTLTTTVPLVVGMPFLLAQETLLAAQLEVGNLNWEYRTPQAVNVVLSQSVSPATVVPLFTQVDLLFNAGPPITYPGTGDAIVPPLPNP